MKAVSGLWSAERARAFCWEPAGERAAGCSPLAGKSAGVKYLVPVLSGCSQKTLQKNYQLCQSCSGALRLISLFLFPLVVQNSHYS